MTFSVLYFGYGVGLVVMGWIAGKLLAIALGVLGKIGGVGK
jgi:hypothetical protein